MTLPVPEYEEQFKSEVDFLDRLGSIKSDFKKQRWVQDFLEHRSQQNEAGIHVDSREAYKVTPLQMSQVKQLFNSERLWGYDLTLISEEEYMNLKFGVTSANRQSV